VRQEVRFGLRSVEMQLFCERCLSCGKQGRRRDARPGRLPKHEKPIKDDEMHPRTREAAEVLREAKRRAFLGVGGKERA